MGMDLNGRSQKQDSKISISKMNWWVELLFCMLMQIQESEKLLDGLGQTWVWSFRLWNSKICFKNELINWAYFLHAGSDTIIFG